MTDLEERLQSLATPTDAGPAAPSLQRLELDAAARHHRHRSARILAAAAAVVVVVALGVVVVRRPQSASLDTASSPPMGSVFGPPDSAQFCMGTPTNDYPTDTTGMYCPDIPSYLSFAWFDINPGTDPGQVDAAMATLRQRLVALGVNDAEVAVVDGHVKVTFPRAFPAGFTPEGPRLLSQDLPLTFYEIDLGADNASPDRAAVVPPPPTTP